MASSVGGAKSSRPEITSAPSACLDSFTPCIASRTICSRSTGSFAYTGSGPRSAAIWLPSWSCSSCARIDTGTRPRSSRPSVRTPRERSHRPSPPATTVRNTSFTVPPRPFFTALKSASSALGPEHAPVRADRHVQRHVGRGVQAGPDHLADPLGGLPGARRWWRRGAGRAHGLAGQPRRACRSRPFTPSADQLRLARLRRGLHALGRAARSGTGGQVEQHGGDVHPRHAVHQRVVGLRDQREAVALEPLHQPDLPQRLGAVQALGEDPPGQPAQLVLRARRGQRRVAHVVVDVEARVVDPEAAGPSRSAGTRASGGSAGPGAAATRCARRTPRARAAGPRGSPPRPRACATPPAPGAGRRRRPRSGGPCGPAPWPDHNAATMGA